MSIERRSIEQVRRSKGRVNWKRLNAVTEDEIQQWQREEGIDETTLGPFEPTPPLIDVKAVRKRLKLSQEEFAKRYLLSLRTVQEWEQHRREPDGPARVLLFLISRDPNVVARVLSK